MLRKIFFLIGALYMTASLGAAPARAATADQTLSVLPNGLKVLVQKDTRFPLVSLRLYVRAGSAYETPKQAGISHLLEHMVFKGTAKRAPGQVAEDIEGAGGYLNAATSFDYTVYKIDVPADRIELGLDVLQDMIFGAAIDAEELEREKKVVLAELERGEDTPTSRIFKSIQPMLWKDSAYEWPIIGYRETVKSITRQDIKDYIARYYQPQSMLAVVCGNVDNDKALGLVEKFFGDLTNTTTLTPKRPLPMPENGGPRFSVAKGPWNKAYVAMAFPIPSLHSDDVAGLDLFGHMLGGDDTSLLYRKFKYELGLVDGISAYSMTLDQVGMLYVSAILDADKLETFWTALQDELATLKASDFSDRELTRAKLNLEDSLYSTKETIGGLTSKIGYFQFFNNSVLAEEAYLSRMNSVDEKELQHLIDTYLTPASACVSVQLPENADAPEAVETVLKDAVTKAWPKSTLAASHDDQSAELGEAEIITIDAGHTLILQSDTTLPYTALSMLFRGGDALLFPDEQGLATLTANALTKGTKNLSAPEYRDYLSDRAAGISANAGRDMFSVSAKYPVRFEADMLDLLEKTLTTPAFAPAEVDRARVEQIAGIHRAEDQPLGLAFRHIFPFLFDGSGYGYLHSGTPEAVESYDTKAISSYWDRQKKQQWTMSVCGSFDRDRIIALAKRLAAMVPAEEIGFATPQWKSGREMNLTLEERNQSHILAIFPVPGALSDETAGLDLLRQTLAGQGGLLFRDLRDRQGLGYTVTAFMWQAPKSGFLAFYIGTSPDKTEQAMKGFEDTVAALRAAPLPEDVISRAKNLLQGDYYREHQSLSSRAREAGGLHLLGQDIQHNRILIEEAQAITPEQLHEIARTYLNWDDVYILTVQP